MIIARADAILDEEDLDFAIKKHINCIPTEQINHIDEILNKRLNTRCKGLLEAAPSEPHGRLVLDKSYRDKSWHTPNKFSVAFFFFIIIQNITSEVELEAFDSINTSELKTRGYLALLT